MSKTLLDLSHSDICYHELWESLDTKDRPPSLYDVVDRIKSLKGTFTRIDLSHNHILCSGLDVLIAELATHELLEEINFSNNRISDFGLKKIKGLMHLPNLRVLNILGNYGPSRETRAELSFRPEIKIIGMRA